MNKKVKTKTKYDDKEDLEIRDVAHYKKSSQVLLLFVLIVLFGFTLFNSLMYIGKYYKNKKELDKGIETIEINNMYNTVVVTNDSKIDKIIEETDDEEIMIERHSSISLMSKDNKKDGAILFDVKYDILKNTFPGSFSSNEDSDIKVKFAYSYDNENWNYISNVISTYNNTIAPLGGGFYDISGVTDTLKVATNYKLTSKASETETIYWKSETYIKNTKDNLNNNINVAFKVEYKESL